MTQEEFMKGYCERSDIDQQTFDDHMVAMNCNCGDPGCNGWAAISNNPRAIKSHQDLCQGEL